MCHYFFPLQAVINLSKFLFFRHPALCGTVILRYIRALEGEVLKMDVLFAAEKKSITSPRLFSQ